MNGLRVTSVQEGIKKLEELEQRQLEVAKLMMEAYGGAVYLVDLLAAAAIKRSLAHSSGFRILIEDKNSTCAGVIIRLQLDTALRFYATFIVENPHDFARSVIEGVPIRKMKDKNGNLMYDACLVSMVSKEYPWVKKVYEIASGYVHFSDKHIFSMFDKVEDDGTAGVKIFATDPGLPNERWCKAIEVFYAVTEILLEYINRWIFTKQNPQLVARVKKEMQEKSPKKGSGIS